MKGFHRIAHLPTQVTKTHVHFTFDNGLAEKQFIDEYTNLKEGDIIEGTFKDLNAKCDFKITRRSELVWDNGRLDITYLLTQIHDL